MSAPGAAGAEGLSSELARQLVATATLPYVLIDRVGTIQWASETIFELLGLRPQQLVGTSALDLLDPVDHALALDALTLVDERTIAGAPGTWEGGAPILEVARGDGTTVRCQLIISTPKQTGYPGIVMQLQRYSGPFALHLAMRSMAANDDVRTVLRHLIEMTEHDLPWIQFGVSWDWNGRGFDRVEGGPARVDLTASLEHRLSWDDPHPPPLLVPVDELAPDMRSVADAAGVREVWLQPIGLAHGRWALVSAWHLGRWKLTGLTEAALSRSAQLVATALRWDDDRFQLAWAATHDQLTGLRNRRSFVADVAQAAEGPTTVLYLDLDDFKPINDNLGHAAGDRVLAGVAERLRNVVRPDDIVARLGGDEFAVLCPGVLDDAAASALATRLLDRVSEPFDLDGTSVRVGLSIGIATIDRSGDPDHLVQRADDALRAAKADGKHRWRRAEA